MALIVATAGTIGGLGLFLLLGMPLLGLSPGSGIHPSLLARRRSRRRADPVEPMRDAVPTPEAMLPPDEVLDPAASTVRRAPILFTKRAARGVERCRVASRLVPLWSEPDELGGALLARLDVGDEVDVLRQEGTHCFVRTPSGAEGWVPGLALTGGQGTTPPKGVGDGH